jgi:hypothetical protein
MVDKELFNKEIDRIEAWDTNYEIPAVMREMWLAELNAIQVSNEDFKAGIEAIFLQAGDIRKRPALPELLKYCGEAKFKRWEKEEALKKSKAPSINNASPATDHGRKALSLIKLFIQGCYVKDGKTIKLTPKDKVDYMLKMEEFYPGHGWEKEAMALARECGLR